MFAAMNCCDPRADPALAQNLANAGRPLLPPVINYAPETHVQGACQQPRRPKWPGAANLRWTTAVYVRLPPATRCERRHAEPSSGPWLRSGHGDAQKPGG